MNASLVGDVQLAWFPEVAGASAACWPAAGGDDALSAMICDTDGGAGRSVTTCDVDDPPSAMLIDFVRSCLSSDIIVFCWLL